MSQLRLGRNPDGTRHIERLEPATARRQGFGGAAIGYFSGVVLTAKQQRANAPRQALPRQSLAERRPA